MADDKKRQEDIAVDWWRDLQPAPGHPDPRRHTGDRATLARLRRCDQLAQAGSEASVIALARSLGITRGEDPRLGNALLTAIVLAHVRHDNRSRSLGRSLGSPGGDQRALLSPLRLSRLLSVETLDERLIAFRRVVALLGGEVNLRDLARTLLFWTDSARIALAFDYHGVPPPGSDTLEPAATNTPIGDAT